MEVLAILSQFFAQVPPAGLWAGIVLIAFMLGYTGAPFLLWTVFTAALLSGFTAPMGAWITFGVFAVVFNLPVVRRMVISGPLMKLMTAMEFLPAISKTEQTAIEAGTVWMDGELFSGKPNFKKTLEQDYPGLTEAEQAFMDGPVEEVCKMTDDWEVTQTRDLSVETWDYLKKHGFFGLIIPKKYGGHGFSASANSAIVAKVSARCQTLGTTVMVPNSLGPAELLAHYGTDEQKDYYLPKLVDGRYIPCFALTEPGAGSDAGAISAKGVVFKGDDGKLYMKLNWEKRYITLAAIATLIGMAFKLYDPENLLGKGEDLGITCALIPSDVEGVELGRRHDPLGVPFYNCPLKGHDVVVPIDAIIGGVEGAGNGWKMLMESLAAGRGISLPASAMGGMKHVARVTSAHAVNRKQFGLSIGKFEGIEEPLARIGGYTYFLDAARRYTLGALDKGAQPAVVTAMAKYIFTETMRKGINDGMDILGGNAISRGPRNLLATGYIGTPVAITVEGANILTRTLMVFGQGAIRCHPYAFAEITAIQNKDTAAFDKAFFGHLGHISRNIFRAIGLSLTRGYLAGSPVGGPAARYYRKLSWTSATFAILADIAMGYLGGDLKRKEKLTGRFADIFSWMYFATATLKRFEAEGRRKEDLPLFHWSMQYMMTQIQEGFEGLFANMSPPLMGWLFKGPLGLWARLNSVGSLPSDDLGHGVVKILLTPGEQRSRITDGLHIPTDITESLGRLENAMKLSHEADSVARKLKNAMKAGKLEKAHPITLITKAVEKGIITKDEALLVQKAEEARNDAIQVDSFTLEEYMRTSLRPAGDGMASGADTLPDVRKADLSTN